MKRKGGELKAGAEARAPPRVRLSSKRVNTCVVGPDSLRFIEALGLTEGWRMSRREDGSRHEYMPRTFLRRGYAPAVSAAVRRMKEAYGIGVCGVERDEVVFFGAWSDAGALHGVAAVRLPQAYDATLRIDAICVAPGRFSSRFSVPRRGTGTSLVRHIVRWARHRGGVVSVCVSATRDSVGFFAQLGFEERPPRGVGTSAAYWLELPDVDGLWDGLLDSERYIHVMHDAIESVPGVHDGQWPLLWKKMGPPLWHWINVYTTNPEMGGRAFVEDALRLPLFRSAAGLLGREGQTLAHYVLLYDGTFLECAQRLFEGLSIADVRRLKTAVWFDRRTRTSRTVLDVVLGRRNISDDPSGWSALLAHLVLLLAPVPLPRREPARNKPTRVDMERGPLYAPSL